MPAAIVLAKRPRPGLVKTRLCPPCTPEEAAAIATVSLGMTIEAVSHCPGVRRVIASDEDLRVPGFVTIAQRGDGLAERLAAAFEDVGGPAVLVGMDTPQIDARLLQGALASLARNDCVIGPTEDGGYWCIGLHDDDVGHLFLDVPMSRADTCEAQVDRLRECGLTPSFLPVLRDVDVFEDARAVARLVPGSPFAKTIDALERAWTSVT